MIGMKTEMEYQMSDFPFGLPSFRFNVPKGSVPSDKQKCQPKAQHEFTIKGVKRSLIIVKSKEICYTKQNKGQRLMNTLRVFSMQNLKSIKPT